MPEPANLVHETSTTTGTGNLTLVNVNGKNNFNDAFGTGGSDVFDYFISNQSAAEWERGTGHMSDATTLVRDTVIESTNADAAVNFSAGTKDVTNDIPAANQIRNENSTVTDGHGVLFDGTSGRAIKSLGAVPNVITPDTVQATTSGTAFDFTIPAGANRITVMMDGIDLSSTDSFLVQIGDSGGIETTGYTSSSFNRASQGNSTTGYIIFRNAESCGPMSGMMILTRITGNTWVSMHGLSENSSSIAPAGGGTKSLSAELTTVRLTRSGTNTFNAGQVNVLYE